MKAYLITLMKITFSEQGGLSSSLHNWHNSLRRSANRSGGVGGVPVTGAVGSPQGFLSPNGQGGLLEKAFINCFFYFIAFCYNNVCSLLPIFIAPEIAVND